MLYFTAHAPTKFARRPPASQWHATVRYGPLYALDAIAVGGAQMISALIALRCASHVVSFAHFEGQSSSLILSSTKTTASSFLSPLFLPRKRALMPRKECVKVTDVFFPGCKPTR